MKTFLSIILTALIYKLCISQKPSEFEYSQLADLFAIDFELASDPIHSYSSYNTKTGLAYSHSTIFELNEISSKLTTINKVLIIVDATIYIQLKNKIKRYAYDINYAYGCKVIMEQVENGDHKDIKDIIISNSTDLNGVVFIGDIPAAWFEQESSYDKYGHEEWPCDLYYMDIDGVWEDLDNDEIYDSHSGNVQPEIFIGRISTANMGSLINEKIGLENYLDKNHMFWIGQITINKKYGLSYIEKDWDDNDYFISDINNIYGSTNSESIIYKYSDIFGSVDYLNRLSDNVYEFIQLACHSSYQKHSFTDGKIYANDIINNGAKAIGYNLFCCSACRWTSASTSSTNGFIAGSYIYNNSNSSLVVVGSTKVGSMLDFAQFYTPLGQGMCFGEAHVEWWVNSCGSIHYPWEISWHYGMTIIGDPLVNLFHCMNNSCESEITLNSFDMSNPSPIQYFLTKNIITISNNNYVIPSGKHVIFNSKNINILENFESNLGGTFEIINEGCESNCP